MFNSLKRYIMLALVIIGAILGALWRIATFKQKRAESEAERALNSLKAAQKRQEVSKNAQKASQDAKVKGNDDVKKAVDNARSGNRDHFNQL